MTDIFLFALDSRQETTMIPLNLSRSELDLLVNAVEIAGQFGWPPGDDRLRMQVLR